MTEQSYKSDEVYHDFRKFKFVNDFPLGKELSDKLYQIKSDHHELSYLNRQKPFFNFGDELYKYMEDEKFNIDVDTFHSIFNKANIQYVQRIEIDSMTISRYCNLIEQIIESTKVYPKELSNTIVDEEYWNVHWTDQIEYIKNQIKILEELIKDKNELIKDNDEYRIIISKMCNFDKK